MRTEFIVVFVTCGSKGEAARIIDLLLKKRLVACGNIISGVGSKFWWKGKINSAKEVLIMLKSKREKFKAIEKELKRLHSYEVPEIVALPIVAGSRDYLAWLKKETQ